MTTCAIDIAASQAVPNGPLTDAELAAVSGGYHCPTQNSFPINDPIAFAQDYWGHCGIATFGDFWYQFTN